MGVNFVGGSTVLTGWSDSNLRGAISGVNVTGDRLALNRPEPRDPQGVMIPLRDVDELKQLMQERLDYEECKAAVDKLIAQLAKNHPNNQPAFKGVMDVFNTVRNQGGFTLNVWPTRRPENAPPGGSGYSWRDNPVWRNGQYIGSDMKTWVYVRGAYTNSSNLAFDLIPYGYAVTGIHEMLHHIGKFFYEEADLDKAARDVGASGVDNYLNRHCVPPRFRGF